MYAKYFTITQANKLLPVIKEEITALKDVQAEFNELWKTYQQLKDGNHVATDAGRIFKLESQLEFMEILAQQHVNNIQANGALLKGIEPALVDFPSFKGGAEILLCWKEGEETISYYHDTKDGFSGRRPL
ncbi:DUF2203 domain-containing protein [Alkalicoccus daliensis]|uniref:DUF2203 family protein n=1 Tax=Alkalicoccus daliensis TaxID=745820 RepID=A0A1H0AIL0_9BACI|nr:DUF2203 domain-containing protein [Alkalicoccus daliensis]SDN32903.1 hypothetical protein SAMN04488053_101486 [Alkalicoccus daliensis]